MRNRLSSSLFFLLLFSQEHVKADASPERAQPVNKPFMVGLGLSTCGEHGCSLVTRFRLEHVSFDLSYGVYPVFFSSKKADADEADFNFAMSVVHADGGVSIFLGDRKKGFQDGIRMQGIFDNVMGPGAGLGWTRERQCSRFSNKCYKHFVLGFGSGIKVYPRYKKWVKDHFDLESDVEISSLSMLQMYLGFTIMWYL